MKPDVECKEWFISFYAGSDYDSQDRASIAASRGKTVSSMLSDRCPVCLSVCLSCLWRCSNLAWRPHFWGAIISRKRYVLGVARSLCGSWASCINGRPKMDSWHLSKVRVDLCTKPHRVDWNECRFVNVEFTKFGLGSELTLQNILGFTFTGRTVKPHCKLIIKLVLRVFRQIIWGDYDQHIAGIHPQFLQKFKFY